MQIARPRRYAFALGREFYDRACQSIQPERPSFFPPRPRSHELPDRLEGEARHAGEGRVAYRIQDRAPTGKARQHAPRIAGEPRTAAFRVSVQVSPEYARPACHRP